MDSNDITPDNIVRLNDAREDRGQFVDSKTATVRETLETALKHIGPGGDYEHATGVYVAFYIPRGDEAEIAHVLGGLNTLEAAGLLTFHLRVLGEED